MHPAHASASHTSHTRQGSVTDGRAARWQRRLCTTTTGAARGACHRRPCRALHVVPCRSCEPSGSRPITAATPAELLRSLRRGRAVKGRCALIHCWCEHVPRAHQMAAKRSAERRPSALLRHGQAARGQYWSLVRLPHRAAAVAACASSGAGFTSWTAEDAAAPWTDGPLPEVVGRLLWSNEDRSRKSGHATHCS